MIKPPSAGFTLLELPIACALILILSAIAIPAYQTFIAGDRSMTQVTQLVSAINFARSEAIKRHSIVTICKSADKKQCGGEWSNGWIIFTDKNAAGKVASPNEILRVYSIAPNQCQLKWEGSRSKNYLQMNPSGRTNGQDGSFVYCSLLKKTHPGYSVIVSQTGRVRIAKGEDADGKPLVCL